MKLKNKKTGEIGELSVWRTADDGEVKSFAVLVENEKFPVDYNSLAELNEDWEDYEEPKEYWYIYGNQVLKNECDGVMEDRFKAIGNYFETKEEAEKAVEKLKAWKRLKDKGFKFKGYTDDSGDLFSCQVIRCSFDYSGNYTESRKDLNLLFGGEE